MSKPQPQLVMRRAHLRRLPESQLAEGYIQRDFLAGDEAGWNRLVALAFERETSSFDFNRMMANHAAFRPERVKFVVTTDGSLVATASSWIDVRFGNDNAMLHYVATDPSHAGRRLGYEVSLAALRQAAAERRGAALLLTDDFRMAAIKTYLRMGFVPVLTDASHADRWRRIFADLSTSPRLVALLDGPLESLG